MDELMNFWILSDECESVNRIKELESFGEFELGSL